MYMMNEYIMIFMNKLGVVIFGFEIKIVIANLTNLFLVTL